MSPALQTFLQHVVNGISLGAIYALIALGYTMVYGILQLINFAHSDVFMVGAFLGYYSGSWIAEGQIPVRSLLMFGFPLGVFLSVLNHRVVARMLKLVPAKVQETPLLRAAVMGAIGAVIGIGWGMGYFTVGTLPPTILGFLPTLPTFQAIGLILVVGGPLLILVRGLWYALAAGLVITALTLGAAHTAFPWIASSAQALQLGAVRAAKDGTVTAINQGRSLRNRVMIGDEPQVLADDDEATVKNGDVVSAGQEISKKGAKAENAGKVGMVGRGPVELKELTLGEDLVLIPPSHTIIVKKDQAVKAGDKLSSGIVIGTPVIVLMFSMVGCATLGFLIERVAYRPLRHAPRINSLITAIGMSLLLINSSQLIFGADPKGFPQIIPLFRPQVVLGVIVDVKQVTVLVTAVVLMLILQYIVYYTRLGLAMRAVSYNHSWAALMGVPVDQVVSATFIIGSSLAAAAGVLEGVTYKKIDPYLGTLLGLKAFVAAVLGGIGNLPGALLGGLLMGLSEEMVAGYWSSNYRDAIAFLILILILLFRPAGLLGKQQVEKV